MKPLSISLLGLLSAGLLTAAAPGAQTLPLPPGAGFAWETVGDQPEDHVRDLAFDAGGTLWASYDVSWLDSATNTWVNPTRRSGRAVLPLGLHPASGPARADTVLYTIGVTRRSTDGGVTWEEPVDLGDEALIEIPAGLPYAGRVVVGGRAGYSDDRGATWTLTDYGDAESDLNALLPLPTPERLPGAASGLDPAAPPDWPTGRIVAAGNRGGTFSDDGGASYQRSDWFSETFGLSGQRLTLVRRPDAHPLGPGPRLIMAAAITGDPSKSMWTSDDAGESWVKQSFVYEPQDGPGFSTAAGVFAVPPVGTADAGATGEALVVLGRGHIYRTTDAGDTWSVVGRSPEMNMPGDDFTSYADTAEMGPDGRLYVGITRTGNQTIKVHRTVSPVVVSDAAALPAAPDLGVTVSPNPSRGAVSMSVAVPSAGAVRVEVFDSAGRRLAVLHEGAVRGALSLDVDTAGWAPGVYVVRVTSDASDGTARFTVAR